MLRGMSGGDAVHVRGTLRTKGRKGEQVGHVSGVEPSVFCDVYKLTRELARQFVLVVMSSVFSDIRMPVALIPMDKRGELRTLQGIHHHLKQYLFNSGGFDINIFLPMFCGDHLVTNRSFVKNENYNVHEKTSVPRVPWTGETNDVHIPTDPLNEEVNKTFLEKYTAAADAAMEDVVAPAVQSEPVPVHPFSPPTPLPPPRVIDWSTRKLHEELPFLVSSKCDELIDNMIEEETTVPELLKRAGAALKGAQFEFYYEEEEEEDDEAMSSGEGGGGEDSEEDDMEEEEEEDEETMNDCYDEEGNPVHDGSPLTKEVVEDLRKDDLIRALKMLGVPHSKFNTNPKRKKKLFDIIENQHLAPELGRRAIARANVYEFLTCSARRGDGDDFDLLAWDQHWMDYVCCSPHLGKALHK